MLRLYRQLSLSYYRPIRGQEMKIYARGIIPIVACTMVFAVTSIHAQVPPGVTPGTPGGVGANTKWPYSFLTKPADTLEDIVDNVKNDPIVLERYKEHFNMTGPEVIEYISNLKATTLAKDTVLPLFFFDKENKKHRTFIRMPKGTRIWVDANNNPILWRPWGNPTIDPTVTGLGAQNQTIGVTGVAEPVPIPQGAPRGFVGAAPDLTGAIGLLALTPLFFVGGGGGGDVPAVNPPITIIPDPITIVTMGAGLTGLALRRRKRRS